MDEYVAKLPAEQQSIMATLRRLMAEEAPNAAEVIAYGSPAWKGNTVLAVASVSKTHITFAFSRGTEFTDAHGLLQGVGKNTRHVKIKKPDAIDEAALRDYIAQAAALDSA